MDRFDEARFGMFVHWSHVSQRGWEMSWPLVGGVPPLADFDAVPIRPAERSCPTTSG